jgi:hypothetical protein
VLGPEIGRAAFVWAAFMVLLGALLMLVTTPGTAGFVISALMVCTGLGFALVIWLLTRFLGR